MKIKIIILLCTVCIIYSCKKDNNQPGITPPATIPMNAYFPLSIGNYWVYEFTTRMPDGTIVGTPSIDTIKVSGDTTINTYTYYILESNKPVQNTRYYRRDSLGYVVNQKGSIRLFPIGNEGLFNFHYGYIDSSNQDTVYSYWEEFQDGFDIVSNVGNYTNCMANIATHQAWPDFGGISSSDTNYYATIGQIQRSFSYLSGAKSVGLIIDYHLE